MFLPISNEISAFCVGGSKYTRKILEGIIRKLQKLLHADKSFQPILILRTLINYLQSRFCKNFKLSSHQKKFSHQAF